MSTQKEEKHSETPGATNPYEDAYSNPRVIHAINASGWFTPDLMVDIHEQEPDPQRKGLGPFNDDRLNIFFTKGFNLKSNNTAYTGARDYLGQRMITRTGHPMSLDQIPFSSHEEIKKLAKQLQLSHIHEVDRGMIGMLDNIIQSIIAPDDIRRPALKILLPWGTEAIKRDIILWAQLGKIGAQEWAENNNM